MAADTGVKKADNLSAGGCGATKAVRTTTDTGELGEDPSVWAVDQVQVLGLDDSESRARLIALLPSAEYEELRNGLEQVFAALDKLAANGVMLQPNFFEAETPGLRPALAGGFS